MASINQLLTTAELAEQLRVSRITIYRMVKNRSIPFIRVGREIRFDAERVLQRLWAVGDRK